MTGTDSGCTPTHAGHDVPLPILIGGHWIRPDPASETRLTSSPIDGAPIATVPISEWDTVDSALEYAWRAHADLLACDLDYITGFLETLADHIEAGCDEIVAVAHRETGLEIAPRLTNVELPRTIDQLRQAAHHARRREWTRPTISPTRRLATYLAPTPGAVVVIGPNNFPLAFNPVCGGDFVAAIATRHPVIAKAHPGHPLTTWLLADLAWRAAVHVGLPSTVLQLLYDVPPEIGERLVADARVAAAAFTGSARAGLALKGASDAAGRPIFVELAGSNPVVVLPGIWQERQSTIVSELAQSLLGSAGQLCTAPSLIFDATEDQCLAQALGMEFAAAPPGVLLSPTVASGLEAARRAWSDAGAELVVEGARGHAHCAFPATLMRVNAAAFVRYPQVFQAEAFGNLALLVVCAGRDELMACVDVLNPSLAASLYGSETDDDLFYSVATMLRQRVGRLIDSRPPTGVAVDPAMHHGGPSPATGNPLFTSVGLPASMERFCMRQCFDGFRDDGLPLELRAANPLGIIRTIDGEPTREAVVWGAAPGVPSNEERAG